MSSPDATERWNQSTSTLGERSAYKKVWDRQAQESDVATLAVAGHMDEPRLDLTARGSIDILKATIGVSPDDVVLEIGCGIGRVGKVLSQECHHWFGADISGAMLRHAAKRLESRPNTTLVELATVGLHEFPRDSFDKVYCTIVFMHLFEWDRYRYVEEAFRVLRPGGSCYFDNFPLDSQHGWEIFMAGTLFPIDRRPAHISMASTREELGIYLRKAGFVDVKVHDLAIELIAATGTKPDL